MNNLYVNYFYKLTYSILLLICLPLSIEAQQRDTLCVESDDPLSYDLAIYGISSAVIEVGAGECFATQEKFLVWLQGNGSDCCGPHDLVIFDAMGQGFVELHVIVKCTKPDCFISDMTDGGGEPTAGGLGGGNLYSCSGSVTTYYLPATIGYTYDWITDQGDVGTGPSIDVIWLTSGLHSITVSVFSGATLINTITRQVEVLAAPVADFTKSASCVCLGGNISFDASSSIGASAYNWDFGDGNTGDGQFANHSYDTPGTYNVVLTVSANNYDPEGNPLCCCSDTMQMEVIVENEEGPPVYWISTLCEGDSSIYWTDATNCTSLTWVVRDASGAIFSHTAISSDTIGVVWPSGPYGTISLTAIGCDQNYCTKPSVVQVPVISSISFVTGDEIVCHGDSKNYSLPKWKGVTYDWSVTGGTFIPNGNNVTVIWDDDPLVTMGSISVTYYNDFLSGLMMADSCIGTGSKDIEIRPRFQVLKDTTVCVGFTSELSVNDPIQSFTWTVEPPGAYTINSVSGYEVEITWDDPGVYVVKATPVDPNVYCIDCNTATIVVKDMPSPLGIDGDVEVCADEPYFYTALTDQSGVEFNWTVIGGTPTSGTGNPIAVTWDATALSHSISLTQYDLSEPGCESASIALTINLKEIDPAITIAAVSGCTNQIQTYMATGVQHPDATVKWMVMLDHKGSVIDEIGQNTAVIQWNADDGLATIIYSVMLCGDTVTVSKDITLFDAMESDIIQVGTLCPGVPGMLQADLGFNNYEWSTGDNGPSNTTVITTPGTYTLTTTDVNMCEDIQFFEAEGSPLPVASISTNDRIICIDTFTIPPPMPPPMPTNVLEISALTAPGYAFYWECNGNPAGITPNIFHTNDYIQGSFLYRVTVTDTNTGCTAVSNSLTVYQDYCDSCNVEQHMIDITAVNDPVFCNIVTFTETHTPNVNPTSWDFGDGNFAGYSGPTITHTYTSAGDYDPQIGGLVYDLNSTQLNDTCGTLDFVKIEVPLAPFFTYEDSCLTVDFADYSSYIDGESIIGYDWDFDDAGATSTMAEPTHVFTGPGTYDVTLIITGSSGCKAIYTETIVVAAGAPPIINITPPMACVGEAITFSGTHPNMVVEWLWDFGDGATNGAQLAEHAYLDDGPFSISLTTLTTDGCETTATASLLIKPNPIAMGINASGPLEFCDGDDVILSVVAAGSATYSWSNLQTTSSITVGTAGSYSVTVTENGCDTILGPIDVFVFPEINTAILGENFICEDQCIPLMGPIGPGYVYQWLDDSMDTIPFQTARTYFACYLAHPPFVHLQITDANGCVSISDPWLLESGADPVVVISNIGDYCAGSPNVLIANITTPGMTNADVTFLWSTGEVGNSIVVDAAGQYTVTAVHNITSCSGSATTVISPLPDFCIMPSGCYTVCNPDTLWAPEGLMSYQWNKDGSPIAGETNPFYYVMMAGSYSVTGTTDDGCTATSDTLILEIKNCFPCDEAEVIATQFTSSDGNECCYNIDYVMDFDSIVALDINTGDADINISNLLADFLLFSNVGGNAVINSTSTSGFLDQGMVLSAFDLCLTNATASPQTVIFSWVHAVDGVVCTDTLIFDCDVSTDCAYIENLDIYCDGEDQYMSFDLCNPSNALFPIAYFSLYTQGPTNFGLLPMDFDVASTVYWLAPIAPGSCQNFIVQLTGVGIEYEELCLGAIVHSDNPDDVPDALCCTMDSVVCAIVPGCTPCEQTSVTATRDTSTNDCCYEVSLFNDFDVVFTNININSLNVGTSIAINNPIGSPWTPTNIQPDNVNLLYTPGEVPLGITALPDICITATDDPIQLIEIEWMIGDDVLCKDTIRLRCEPPCGYFLEDHQQIICLDDGTWVFQGIFKNTTAYTISEVYVAFDTGSGLDAYNQTITGLSIPPMGTSPVINIPIGPPAMAGDEVCMNFTLHSIDSDGNPFACCVFKHCIILPDCQLQVPCLCDSKFEDAVQEGIDCIDAGNFNVSIVHAGELLPCDEITYYVDGVEVMTLGPNVSFSYNFGGPGMYKVCISVLRIADDGKVCESEYCKKIEIEQNAAANIAVYPNPSANFFNVDLRELQIDEETQIKVYDINQKLIMTCKPDSNKDKITSIRSEDFRNGLYFIMVDNGISIHRKTVLIVK